MICRLCLALTDTYFNLFDTKGVDLNASEIVGKYFWFQPQRNDCISEVVCKACWNIIENFHNLYLKIQESQKVFLANVKIDSNEIYSDDYQSSNIDFKEIFESSNQMENETPLTVTTNLSQQEDIEIKNEIFAENSSSQIECPKRATRRSTRLKSEPKLQITAKKSLIPKTNKVKSKIQQSENIIDSNTDSTESADGLIKYETKKKKTLSSLNKEKSLRQVTMKKEDDLINNYLKIECPICSAPLENYNKVSSHFLKNHKEKSYIECCSIKFYKRNKLVDHVQKHTNPDHFKCNECGKVLKNRWCYKLHQKSHSNKEVLKNYECKTCNKKFVNPSSLQRHEVTHIPESEKHYACDICGKLYATKGILEAHKRNIHQNRAGGVCDLCGKQYRQTADLRRHRLQHEGIVPDKIQCHLCHQWYTSKYKLTRHLRRHQETNLTFPCPHCNKVTPSREALKSHIRYIHKMERKYPCNLCEKAFRQPIELKEHLAHHSGAKLYVCPHCPKTFSHNSNLHHHRKQVHRKEFEEMRALKGKRDINWKSVIEISNAPMGIELIEDRNNVTT